ncbi:ATP-binding protein [Marinoscillum sp.]|uniref:ATP-binding protein n=1 Tax=Marinoscillum sp. TaxID=2024838 RepID=UPI003BAD36F4
MKLIVNFVSQIRAHLKRRHIANFIGFLLILLTLSVTGIGYITYKNLNEIVSGLENDSSPNDNLILYKEVMISISAMENKVESYQLTGNSYYLQEYDLSVEKVRSTLDSLNRRNPKDRELIALNDSLARLVNRKTELLNDILQLSQKDQEPNLNPLVSQIDEIAAIKIPDSLKDKKDTITKTETAPEEKGFFKKLFKKKPITEQTTIITDKAVNTDSIYLAQTEQYQNRLKEALSEIQQTNAQQSAARKAQELILQNEHDDVQQTIMDLIGRLESRETMKMEINSLEAKELASRTNQQIVIFSSLTFLLLLTTIIIIFSYVQKNKKYQQLLKRSKDAAETLAKAKERFFANMSHEIRTPMNAISGFSKVLMKSDLDTNQREQMEIINKSSDHLLKLLNDILDFSKLQALKLQLEKKPFNLKELLEDTCKLLNEPAKEKGLELRQTYYQLPEYINGDPYRLKQILINLLNNSIKYTDTGHVELKVVCKAKKDKAQVTIQVIDTGKGIPKDNQHRLFQEFEQSDQSSFSKGTGLGLAITKRLVQLHHGRIKLESTEGKGTTVTVNLPYEISNNPPIEKKSYEYTEDLSGKHILIADDEPFNVKLLTTLLDKHRATYDTASDGAAAMSLLQQNPYDIILMDLKMPKMSGWEVVKSVRESDGPNKEQPFIALTATVAQIDKKRTEQSGFNHILRKPFDEGELFTLISKSTPSAATDTSSTQGPTSDINLSSLERMGDRSFVIDMVQTFIDSATKEWSILEQSLAANDLATVANSAHKIVAPARHLKAEALVKLLKAMEKMADANVVPDQSIITNTEKELDKVITQLTSYLENEETVK